MRKLLLTTLMILSFSAWAEQAESFSFKATATGIGPTAQIEFIMISPESGHDYESIAISTITPDEIYEGLKRLGAEAGWPVDVNQLRFYPRGERLQVRFSWAVEGTNYSASAHELIVDETRDGHLVEDYFIFSGSNWTTNDGVKTLTATVSDPGSILSTYNDWDTLLDRPVRAPKNIVYGTLFANPDFVMPKDTEIDVEIRRVAQDATFQPVTARLAFSKNDEGEWISVKILGILEIFTPGKEKDFLEIAERWESKYPEIGLKPEFAPHLPLEDIQRYAGWLAVAEEKAGTVVLPPASQDLFYRSFLPPPAFRNPATRPSQPWEVLFEISEAGDTNTVIRRYITTSRDPQGKPMLEEKIIDDQTLEAWAGDLKLEVYDPPVLLIHIDGDMTYSELLKNLEPIREVFDTYYVFQ